MSYLADPKKFFDDLADANKHQAYEKFRNTLREFILEVLEAQKGLNDTKEI